eukprot:gb/GEZN01022404.1/.p1 GENE.gb/GEZN01022404.1/~~gb/GEZN01022404.1/.p1  ORF type:complete len:114 (-),score=4.88 gb/GEZN01022404.1/:232-573(-)
MYYAGRDKFIRDATFGENKGQPKIFSKKQFDVIYTTLSVVSAAPSPSVSAHGYVDALWCCYLGLALSSARAEDKTQIGITTGRSAERKKKTRVSWVKGLVDVLQGSLDLCPFF